MASSSREKGIEEIHWEREAFHNCENKILKVEEEVSNILEHCSVMAALMIMWGE
jgi:hypothetical protein